MFIFGFMFLLLFSVPERLMVDSEKLYLICMPQRKQEIPQYVADLLWCHTSWCFSASCIYIWHVGPAFKSVLPHLKDLSFQFEGSL